jgi:hypothetical protein
MSTLNLLCSGRSTGRCVTLPNASPGIVRGSRATCADGRWSDDVSVQSCTATRPHVADGGGARPKTVELNDYPSASLPTLHDATVADLHTLRVPPSLSQRHLQWAASPPPPDLTQPQRASPLQRAAVSCASAMRRPCRPVPLGNSGSPTPVPSVATTVCVRGVKTHLLLLDTHTDSCTIVDSEHSTGHWGR